MTAPTRVADNDAMKRLLAAGLLAAIVWSAAPARADLSDWWRLGYRPGSWTVLPVREEQTAERYRVSLEADYLVLGNPKNEPVRVWLPLPADDAYQNVFAYRLRPRPANILYSRDGYQIAVFEFGPRLIGETVTIRYDAEVRLRDIGWQVDPARIGSLTDVPAQIRADYLVDGPLYDIHHPAIEAAAREAVGEATAPLEIMTRIVAFVRSRLDYDLDGQKPPAPEVLAAGHGSCTEHVFLMIALARNRGLPARYMAGSPVHLGLLSGKYVDRVFHKVVEVYLPGIGWTPVESSAGSRWRAKSHPAETIGRLQHRMLFFGHEPEPGLAPLNPRRNIATYAPFRRGSQLKIKRNLRLQWRRL